jgi:hypothetical protein
VELALHLATTTSPTSTVHCDQALWDGRRKGWLGERERGLQGRWAQQQYIRCQWHGRGRRGEEHTRVKA